MRQIATAIAVWLISTAAVAGDCRLLSTVCAEGPETRTINGVDVYRECWRYHSEYECLTDEIVEEQYCADLRERGCSQISSACIEQSAYGCLTYEQTYQCPSNQPPTEQALLDCGGQLFCLEGNCFDTGYPPNKNMSRAGALLSVMDALSNELSADHVEVFKGNDMRCGVSFTDAIGAHNCCKLSGWAIGLIECKPEEEQLAELRKAGRCHYVGTYCANDPPIGGCLLDKQTYCCFSSKLSRIIAEQGRAQLARGWGSAEYPDCRGFTLDEVSQLDFEAMDLSEFYADVMAAMPDIDATEMQQRIQDKMNQLLP